MSQWAFNTLPDLSDDEFREWQLLLEERTGITFDRHRRILQNGLTQRLREIHVDSYHDYFLQVRSGVHGAVEWEALLKTLTVKETRFFRDPDAYLFLKKFLLEYVPKQTSASLEIWSAACSTGEEAYSLAMLANDVLASMQSDKFFGVTATDICMSTLSVARQGVYTKRKLDVLGDRSKKQYFDELEQSFSVKESLKQRVCFVQANLVQESALPISNLDVVYCQNVLIYFKKSRQYAVLDSLVDRMRTGGVLIIGMAEAQGWVNPAVKKINNDKVQAYQKVA
ncbi:MAG: protein-glutamate O-methyltransferase CheR [Sinobacterium sp.]|nr:protein-glutamate O-methyltransferase CheR [Sinobacterium sp.]